MKIFRGVLVSVAVVAIVVVLTGCLTDKSPMAVIVPMRGENNYINPRESICFDGSFSRAVGSDVVMYSWESGDGQSTGWQDWPTHCFHYEESGKYRALLSVMDSEGRESTYPAEFIVVVNERPRLSFWSSEVDYYPDPERDYIKYAQGKAGYRLPDGVPIQMYYSAYHYYWYVEVSAYAFDGYIFSEELRYGNVFFEGGGEGIYFMVPKDTIHDLTYTVFDSNNLSNSIKVPIGYYR